MAAACSKSEAKTASDAPAEERGKFCADSAYAYVAEQVAFGPRVPGSPEHRACADRLVQRLKDFGADTVMEFNSEATAWDGTRLPVRNIFARFDPEKASRILLLAHYDTRPWADQDPDPANRHTPIDGANDGASGVGVLLEVARCIGTDRPDVGVDILLVDAEDYGAHAEAGIDDASDSWCLGSQHFASHLPYPADKLPRYGILLDMVGGSDARFNREYFSTRYARQATGRVWATAESLGLSSRFVQPPGGAITDDHMPLIEAGIPTTDIIECNSASTGNFPPTWHTLNDNLENIDPAALGDTGRTLLQVIYTEKP